MAALDFKVLADAKTLIIERFGTEPEDAETLLEASAAEDCTTSAKVYRPYYVLGVLMGANWVQFKSVASAAGSSVEYATPHQAQRAVWGIQAALDRDLCGIPVGFTAAARFEPVM